MQFKKMPITLKRVASKSVHTQDMYLQHHWSRFVLAKLFGEEMSFKSLLKGSKRKIPWQVLWQVVPVAWGSHRKALVCDSR